MEMDRKDMGTDASVSLICVIALACTICLLLTACGAGTQEQWQEQYDLGQQYLLDGDYEQAIVAFTAAIEIDPSITDAYLGRAEAYIGGDIDSALAESLNLALADYDAAIELDETLTGAYVNRGDVHVALGTTSDLEEAISDYTSAIALDDTQVDVYVSRGNVYCVLGTKDGLSAAVADYESAIALDDSLVDLYLKEAEIYILLGSYEDAEDAYTDAIDGGLEDSGIYLALAGLYYEQAQSELGGVTSENDSDITETAQAYLNDALKNYLAALEMGDTTADTYLAVAEIYLLLGDSEEAAEILDDGRAYNPYSEELARLSEELALEQKMDYFRENYLEFYVDAAKEFEQSVLNFTTATDHDYSVNLFSDGLYNQEIHELFEEEEADSSIEKRSIIFELDDGYYLMLISTAPGSWYIYYGEMEEGERSGYGMYFSQYGNFGYVGEWADDKLNGQAAYINGNRLVEISFVDGKAQGEGTFYHNLDGKIYQCAVIAEDGSLIGLYADGSGKLWPVLQGYSSGLTGPSSFSFWDI